MTYIVEQKIKGHVYLYEVESYWDSEKKQARQNRKYIGKKDPETLQVITPRKLPTVLSAADFGHLYLLRQLAEQIGLTQSLKEIFGRNETAILLDLACFNVLEGKALYLYETWSCGMDDVTILSSQSISKKLHQIGSSQNTLFRFFEDWGQRQKPLKGAWLDITSISSYGQQNSWVEWGYNRDKEALPQVNLGVLMGGKSNLPFFYHLYPGSIADVSTLHNIALNAKELGFEIETWVMDRGFFSASNLHDLHEHSYQFITAMPSTLKEHQRLLAKSQSTIRSPNNSFCLGKEVLFFHDTTCCIGKHKFRAIVYLSDKRRAQETEAFIRRLDQVEQAAKESRHQNLEDAIQWLGQQWRGCASFFDVSLNDDQKLQLKRKRNALSYRLNRMGKMILVTDQKKLSAKEILDQYRQKDRVEKIYDVLKNSLNEERLRVHSQESMHGKMFVTFLSLILQTALSNRMSNTDLSKKYALPEILMEMKKIRIFKRSQEKPSFLSEISKKQRQILDTLNIPIPLKT